MIEREGYTKSGRRKSKYCSVCAHTELQHSVNGLPSHRASIVCRKCNKDCNRTEWNFPIQNLIVRRTE